jgi:hypothetical protein
MRLLWAVGLLFALFWYFTQGAGGLGRSPRGTALAFTQAIGSNRCADTMNDFFPNVSGARSLCTPDLHHAFSSRRSVRMLSVADNSAVALCFFGTT